MRANPKLSGTKNNVFGIQTGVAVSFLVKQNKIAERARIFYARRPELETRDDKLTFLSSARLSSLETIEVRPDAKQVWLNQTENDFDSLLPIASRKTKSLSQKAIARGMVA